LAEIDARDDIAMDYEQKAIAGEEFRQIGIFVFARNDFVHGEADSFQTLELLNLADDGGLVNVNQRTARVGAE